MIPLPTHDENNAVKMKERIASRYIFAALAGALVLLFAFNILRPEKTSSNSLLGSFFDIFKPKTFQNSQTNPAENVVVKVVSEESQVIEVVKKSTPAVVSVIASADVPKLEICYQEERPFGLEDDFFNDFFSFRVPGYCQRGTEKKRVGAGSGFLVSNDGYILTNKHVVSNEKAEYTVILNDKEHKGQKVSAVVLAKDPTSDIAILKIDMTALPYLPFGDSEKLQVGQTAIAIGYALGEFENTVSKGVVSGLARSITASGSSLGQPEYLEGVIQTDAAINPGNSGGPLLDINGNVIGMNVAMASAQNIGFAIPANEARKVFEDVQRTGKVERAFLGVRYMMITKELKEKNNLPFDYGALIVRGQEPDELAVVPGSPADKAGISENDIILEIDGRLVDQETSLARSISRLKVGDKIKMKIYHKGEEKTVEVILEERK